jgi:hypothetical protein
LEFWAGDGAGAAMSSRLAAVTAGAPAVDKPPPPSKLATAKATLTAADFLTARLSTCRP